VLPQNGGLQQVELLQTDLLQTGPLQTDS